MGAPGILYRVGAQIATPSHERKLRGGAATKVVGALLARGLIREHIVDSPRKADPAINTIWRNLPEPDGRGVLLFITAAGAEAIGIEPEAAVQFSSVVRFGWWTIRTATCPAGTLAKSRMLFTTFTG